MSHTWIVWGILLALFVVSVGVQTKMSMVLDLDVRRWIRRLDLQPPASGPRYIQRWNTLSRRQRQMLLIAGNGATTLILVLIAAELLHVLYGSYGWIIVFALGLITFLSHTYLSLRSGHERDSGAESQ